MAEDVELAESVSVAMLTVLETLGPAARVVFVLHEVFEMAYKGSPHSRGCRAVPPRPLRVTCMA